MVGDRTRKYIVKGITGKTSAVGSRLPTVIVGQSVEADVFTTLPSFASPYLRRRTAHNPNGFPARPDRASRETIQPCALPLGSLPFPSGKCLQDCVGHRRGAFGMISPAVESLGVAPRALPVEGATRVHPAPTRERAGARLRRFFLFLRGWLRGLCPWRGRREPQ